MMKTLSANKKKGDRPLFRFFYANFLFNIIYSKFSLSHTPAQDNRLLDVVAFIKAHTSKTMRTRPKAIRINFRR